MDEKISPMIAAAGIDVYQKNIFRITGLPVDATEKQIKRRADELKMAEEFGDLSNINRGAYPIEPPPSAEQIREAMQRLKEPEQRLIDEFFWFWPREFGRSDSDAAIQAMLAGDADTAFDKIWEPMESSPEYDFIAWHNIAVTYHLVALDWTTYHMSAEVDQEREAKIKNLWQEAFKRWEKIATEDRVWDYVRARVRALDDPRLTTGFVRRMRDSFPEALDKINAWVALKYAEQGRMDWATQHVQWMNETNQGLDDVEKTAELILTPTRKRILQYIQIAKDETDKNPADGAKAAGKLLMQCVALQGLFDLFHGAKSYHKTELFDEVVTTAINCVVSYQRANGDNNLFVAVLKECLSLATSADVKQRVRKNIEIGEGNLESQEREKIKKLCHFCGQNTAQSGCAQGVSMHKVISRDRDWITGQRKVNYRHLAVPVPRCTSCKNIQDNADRNSNWGCFIWFAIVALGIGLGIAANNDSGWWIGGLIGLGIGLIIWLIAVNVLTPKSNLRPIEEYMEIKELVKDGWQFGEKPSV